MPDSCNPHRKEYSHPNSQPPSTCITERCLFRLSSRLPGKVRLKKATKHFSTQGSCLRGAACNRKSTHPPRWVTGMRRRSDRGGLGTFSHGVMARKSSVLDSLWLGRYAQPHSMSLCHWIVLFSPLISLPFAYSLFFLLSLYISLCSSFRQRIASCSIAINKRFISISKTRSTKAFTLTSDAMANLVDQQGGCVHSH